MNVVGFYRFRSRLHKYLFQLQLAIQLMLELSLWFVDLEMDLLFFALLSYSEGFEYALFSLFQPEYYQRFAVYALDFFQCMNIVFLEAYKN